MLKRAIAALWAWEGGILAKAATAVLAEDEHVDVASDSQLRTWFEALPADPRKSSPPLLHVFSLLEAGLHLHRTQREWQLEQDSLLEFLCNARKTLELGGRPGSQPDDPAPRRQPGPTSVPPWVEYESSDPRRIKGTLDWWLGKCGFCIGRGFSVYQSAHPILSCPRGGEKQFDVGLGRIFVDGFRLAGGCSTCGIPRRLCGADGQAGCQYNDRACVSLMGLCQSGEEQYLDCVLQSMADAKVEGCSDARVVEWLCGGTVLGEIPCARAVAELVAWTPDIVRECTRYYQGPKGKGD